MPIAAPVNPITTMLSIPGSANSHPAAPSTALPPIPRAMSQMNPYPPARATASLSQTAASPATINIGAICAMCSDMLAPQIVPCAPRPRWQYRAIVTVDVDESLGAARDGKGNSVERAFGLFDDSPIDICNAPAPFRVPRARECCHIHRITVRPEPRSHKWTKVQ